MREGERNIIKDNGTMGMREGRDDCRVVWLQGRSGREGSGAGGGFIRQEGGIEWKGWRERGKAQVKGAGRDT